MISQKINSLLLRNKIFCLGEKKKISFFQKIPENKNA